MIEREIQRCSPPATRAARRPGRRAGRARLVRHRPGRPAHHRQPQRDRACSRRKIYAALYRAIPADRSPRADNRSQNVFPHVLHERPGGTVVRVSPVHGRRGAGRARSSCCAKIGVAGRRSRQRSERRPSRTGAHSRLRRRGLRRRAPVWPRANRSSSSASPGGGKSAVAAARTSQLGRVLAAGDRLRGTDDWPTFRRVLAPSSGRHRSTRTTARSAPALQARLVGLLDAEDRRAGRAFWRPLPSIRRPNYARERSVRICSIVWPCTSLRRAATARSGPTKWGHRARDRARIARDAGYL